MNSHQMISLLRAVVVKKFKKSKWSVNFYEFIEFVILSVIKLAALHFKVLMFNCSSFEKICRSVKSMVTRSTEHVF